MKKRPISIYRFVMTILLISSALFTSCFGPKNLVSRQRGASLYDFVGDTLDGWALVRQDSLWGYLSANGKRTIKPSFQWATDFNDGMALVRDKHGYRYLNNQGRLIRRVKAQHAYSFAEGLTPIEKKGKWSYINRKGKKVIKTRFDWAEPFHEGRAAVAVGLKKGYINKQGTLAIPAVYQEAHPFKNGVAVVRKDLRWGIIDTLGNFRLVNQYDKIEHWGDDFYLLAVFNPKTNWPDIYGLADAQGKLLLDTLYSSISLVKGQYLRVKKDSLVGLFDLKAAPVIPMEYTSLGYISDEGFIAAIKNQHGGFLNQNGAVVLPFVYDPYSAMGFSEGRTWVRKDSTYILMDDQFREIRRFSRYNNVYSFTNGYAVVSIKDTADYYGSIFGYIDRDGNEVVSPQFDGGAGYINRYGISVVGKKSLGIVREHLFNIHTGALVNEKEYSDLKEFGSVLFNNYGDFVSGETGKPIPDFPYPHLNTLEYGDRKDLAVARRDGKEGLIDTSLNEVLPLAYQDLESYHHGRMKIRKNGNWGYVDSLFRIRIPMIYDDAYYFQYPMLTSVSQNKKSGVINREGQEIIPLKYKQITFDDDCGRIYADKGDEGFDIYDRTGRLLLATDFSYIGFYGRKNYAAYRQHDKLGFMDYDFKVLLKPEFDGCGRFYDGMAWVRKDKKFGYINDKFKLVIPVQFDECQHFIAGLAMVKQDGREYFINTKGEEVVPTEEQFEERKREVRRRHWDVDENFR